MQLGRRMIVRVTPGAAAFLMTAALASALAQSVYRIPVQVSDSLEPTVLSAGAESTAALFLRTGLHASATTLRPLRYVQARWLLEVAEWTGRSYGEILRGAHCALLIGMMFLFTSTAGVRCWRQVAALGVALTVLTGLHTFAGMMREAYPVNHFAEVAFCALAVLALARRAPSAAVDLAVAMMLAFCLLLVESGVLIWVVVVSCATLGLPGMRSRTVAIATGILIGYVGLRVALGIGASGIGAHASGFGAAFYSPDQLRQRFGPHPLAFVTYNVIGAALSVLLSEPRSGVYQLAASLASGTMSPVVVLNMTSSAAMTMAIAWVIRSAARTRPRDWSAHERTAVIAAVVLAANAAMCAAYIKDEILSVAGVFYALAAFAATDAVLQRLDAAGARRAGVALLTIAMAVTTSIWAFRAAGVHYQLRIAAFRARNEWTEVPTDSQALTRQSEITRRLKAEALSRRVTSPSFLPPWGKAYWVE